MFYFHNFIAVRAQHTSPLFFFLLLLLLLPVSFSQSAYAVRVRSTRTQIARWRGHFLGRPFLLHNDILAVRVRKLLGGGVIFWGGDYHYTTIFWPSILISFPYEMSLFNFLIKFPYSISLFNSLIRFPYLIPLFTFLIQFPDSIPLFNFLNRFPHPASFLNFAIQSQCMSPAYVPLVFFLLLLLLLLPFSQSARVRVRVRSTRTQYPVRVLTALYPLTPRGKSSEGVMFPSSSPSGVFFP